MSLFTGAAIIGAALAAGTGMVTAAKISSDSAKEGGDKASASNSAALAFQKEQAENEYRNQETTRRANYDQHVAQAKANNRTRQALGLAPVDIPEYVPSVDPGFTGAPPPAAGGPSIGTTAGAPPQPFGPAAAGGTPRPGTVPAPPQRAPAPPTPQFLPMDGMTLGQMAGAPPGMPPSAWTDWQQAIRNRTQT